LRQNGSRELIPNVLEFHTTLNPGALFGLGAGQTSLFVLASVLALALVLWMFTQCPARQRLTQIALGAILAGALGNMYDRINVRLYRVPVGGAGSVAFYVIDEQASNNQWIALREYYAHDETDPVRRVPHKVVDQWGPPTGHVRDFIKISQKWFGGRDVWPWVFNVADMLLVGGVGILAIRLIRDHRRRPADTKADLDEAPAQT
jgi:lipoprotein signal peptidase